MDNREKNVFAECERIAAAQTAEDTTIEAGEHAEFIVQLAGALAYNTYERMLLIVKMKGRSPIYLMMRWLRFLALSASAVTSRYVWGKSPISKRNDRTAGSG